MLSRRALIASPALLAAGHALAAVPADVLLVAKQIDDLMSLDPAESFEASGGDIIGNLYERLVVPDPADPTRLIGELAESWEVSADGMTHRFLVRESRAFASGNPVTAADAAFSVQRAIRLNKAPAFILGQFGLTPETVETMVRADGRTVTIRTAKPMAASFVRYCLTANVASIVEQATVLAHAAGDDLGNGWLRKASAGSGPWSLRSWRANETVVLERNPRSPLAGPIGRAIISHVPDPSAQLLLLRKRDADIARNLGPEQLDAATREPGATLVTADRAFVMYLGLNQSHSALSRPGVRQAIKWAIDYDGIARNLVAPSWRVHQAFLPAGMPGAWEQPAFHLDPARAKALLTEAGLADGFEVTIDHPAGFPYPEVAQAVQANLAAIGVRAILQAGDLRQVITKTRARQHQAALLYWGSDYFDPHSNAQTFCINPDNSDGTRLKTVAWRNNFVDEAMTQLAQASVAEPDPERRLAGYRTLQTDLQARGPFVILFQQVDVAVTASGVSGFRLSGLAGRTQYAAARKQV